MAIAGAPNIRPVSSVGSSKDDLSALHEDVKDAVGQALFEAQKGGRHPSAKPLRGYGDASGLEIVVDHEGDTLRAVYAVRLPDRLYVLHVFQKKSKSGRKTPKGDIDLVDARLKRVWEHYEAASRSEGNEMSDGIKIEEGSGNVFADLGFPDAEERLAKADLVTRIAEGIRERRLTQAKAAELFGIDQPKVSRLLRGQLSGYSAYKLMHFLTLLGRDVVIVVKPSTRRPRGPGHVKVIAEA